jgi:hypothetical protein
MAFKVTKRNTFRLFPVGVHKEHICHETFPDHQTLQYHVTEAIATVTDAQEHMTGDLVLSWCVSSCEWYPYLNMEDDTNTWNKEV